MTPLEPSSDPLLPANEFSRRSFMKKSALTLAAVTILGRGIGFAGTDGFPGTSGTGVKDVEHTVTVTVTFERLRIEGETTSTPAVINYFNGVWSENEHGSGEGKSTDTYTSTEPIITTQVIHLDAKLVSSNSVVTNRHWIVSDSKFKQEITTVRTYVYGDP